MDGLIGPRLMDASQAIRDRTGAVRDTLGPMGFCEHCEGQRFDRARVLRLLRTTRRTLDKGGSADEALRAAIEAVRALDIPHMERFDEIVDGEIIH